jgi:membrane protein implicated in regulation of membrane protease activity
MSSMIGYLPQMAIFALMGKGVIVLSIWKVVLSIVLFVISSLLSVRLYKQYRADSLIDGSELADLKNIQQDEAISK